MIWEAPPPAIIIPRPVADWRFVVNDGREWDCGSCLPRDFRELPKVLRRSVSANEIRDWLPEPYRKLGDDLIWSLVLGNVPALPSAILAGSIKYAWLFTATGNFTVPSDWNKYDNAQHAVGKGGNGASALESSIVTNGWYGGAGGGGAAYAGNRDMDYAVADILTATISTDVTFDSASVLKADGAGNAGSVSGGSSSGGAAGLASASVGSIVYDGEAGVTVSGYIVGGNSGSRGGSAAGPSGSPSGARADNGEGGIVGDQANAALGLNGQDGVDGPGGGWNPNGNENAGSGGGGSLGYSNAGSRNGGAGGQYGGGGGGSGGGGSGGTPGTPGTGTQGCVLVVNNPSA